MVNKKWSTTSNRFEKYVSYILYLDAFWCYAGPPGRWWLKPTKKIHVSRTSETILDTKKNRFQRRSDNVHLYNLHSNQQRFTDFSTVSCFDINHPVICLAFPSESFNENSPLVSLNAQRQSLGVKWLLALIWGNWLAILLCFKTIEPKNGPRQYWH